MGIHSGKFGVGNGLPTLRNWSVNEQRNNTKYVASNTLGATGRLKGVHSWTGSYGQYGAVPIVMPGNLLAFIGYTSPSNDVEGANGLRITGNAMIDSVAINWNWANGEGISMVSNFSGHLDPAWSSAAALTDATDPDVPPICDVIFEQSDDGVTWAEIPDLVQAVLTFSAPSVAYVNSSTGCYTGRRPGILDWTLALTQQNDDRVGGHFDTGDNILIRCYVDDANYWLLKWGAVKDFTGLTVDRETGAIIQRTINIEMNGFVDGDTGTIEQPGEVQFWPFS